MNEVSMERHLFRLVIFTEVFNIHLSTEDRGLAGDHTSLRDTF